LKNSTHIDEDEVIENNLKLSVRINDDELTADNTGKEEVKSEEEKA
jgi:hypothetical protein